MKRYLLFLLMVVIVSGLVGCGSTKGDNSGMKTEETANPSNMDGKDADGAGDGVSKATEYPLTVKDATGLEFTFTKAPERIVSTSPSETEILFALDLGDQIVGVSDYDNYPEEALTKPKVGGIVKPNEEAIIAANPDLVIVGISMEQEVVDKLRSLKLNLFKTEPKKFDEVMDNILLFGVITDRQKQAEALVDGMKEDIRKVTEAVGGLKQEDRKKVYIEFSLGWTVGKGEFMDELITLAGGVNIASDMVGWNAINEEKIIQDNPDVILFTLGVKDEETGKTLDQIIKNRSGWDKITAIRENRLVGLDQDTLSRTGPRLAKGLLDIAQAVYPELVNE